MIFELLRRKMMQNHYEISSKTLFWTQNMKILTKSRDLVMSSPDLVMSGPEKSWFGHVRTWKVLLWSCPDLKSPDLDMSGPVQEDKYLLQNSGNTFFLRFYTFPFFMTSTYFKTAEILFFWDFTPFPFWLANLSFFNQIICFY